MIDNTEVCRILLQNIRTMCEEIDELLVAPTQREPGLVRNQLEFVTGKLELAVGMASHGAGMIAAPEPEEPPQRIMPSFADIVKELQAQLHGPDGPPKVERPRRRKAAPRKRKAA